MKVFIEYWFHNLNPIMDVLIGAMLLLLFVWAFISFRMRKGMNEEVGGIDSKELESTLRRVLESTALKTTAVNSAMDAHIAEGTTPSPELSSLKKLLDEKTVELSKLQGQLAQAGNAEDAQNKIRDLEAKLSEYEFIVDDIANLSLYKDENKRLKEELEKLKASDSKEDDAFDNVVDQVLQEEEQKAEAIAAKPEDIFTVKPEVEKPVVSAPAAADDDIMSEFAAAVEEQLKTPPHVVVPKPKQEITAEDDILSEFVAAVAEQENQEPKSDAAVKENIAQVVEKKESEEESARQELESKLAEMEQVQEKTSVLDKETDTDKLLSEMDQLLNVKTEVDAEEEEDSAAKLISEFEKITKNG